MKAFHRKSILSGIVVFVLLVSINLMRREAEELPSTRASEIGSAPSPATEIRQTADWISQVSNLDPQEGLALAKERGERMRELIRTDPERAIRESLSLSEWSSLPENVREHVEQPFSAVANVDVIISCGDGISQTDITTELSGIGRMETYVYGRRGAVGSKNGSPVQGIRIGDIGALREEIFQTLEPADEEAALKLYPVAIADPGGNSVAALAGGKVFYFEDRAELDEANAHLAALEELPGPDAGTQGLFEEVEAYLTDDGKIDFQALEDDAYAASAEWTGSPRDMYVIMVDFPDLPGQPTDPHALSNSINTTVSQQIWDMSYEKTHIICAVNTSTYRMADVSTSYVDTLSSYPNAYRMYSNATALVEADGVDLSPYETICIFFADIDDITYAGLANISGKRMWINGTTSTKTFTHELGHNYGAKHADFWQPTNNDPVDPSGSEIGYGDFTDIMGSGSVPSGHFNAWHKRHLSWFDADNWQSVTNSGTYRVFRGDHRQTTGLLRGLEIQKGVGDQYWVGLRQELVNYETFSRGAYVLWKMSGDNESDLLDMTPQSDDGKYDGGLALGQTYSDTSAAVHITPVDRGGQTPNEWMDITVNLGSFPGNTAPTASLSGATNLNIQESTVFSVTASDLDGDELAYYWDIGDGLVKPNAPSIPVAWTSGGTATVSCTVSDMKGGTTNVSQSVVLSSPLDNWAKRTSGTTYQLNDIALGNGRLVAVGRDWRSVYSDDGTNWTVVVSPYNAYLEGVIYDGSQFVAAGFDSDGGWYGAVFTSSNGESWTRRYLAGPDLSDVAYGDGVYVAVGLDGTIVRSTDSINWSNVTSGTSTHLQNVSYGDGVFVAVGDGGYSTPHVVLTSTNGMSWEDHSSGSGISGSQWMFEVEYCNDRFLAGGGWRSGIQHSTDRGQSFQIGADDDYEMDGFAYGDGIYLATGVYTFTGRTNDINLISLDGANWTELSTVSKDNQNAAIYYNGTFITVGDNGSIWQSDAVTETAGGYAMWQLENASALGYDRDPLEDADFDGHLNLAEYALGTTATDAGSVPANGVLSADGTYFHASYERDGIKDDIDYSVKRTTHLVSNDWSSAATVVVEDSETNLTARSAFTMASQTNEFLRLDIDLQ